MYKFIIGDNPNSIEKQLNELAKEVNFTVCSHSISVISTTMQENSPLLIGKQSIAQVRMGVLMLISVLVKIEDDSVTVKVVEDDNSGKVNGN